MTSSPRVLLLRYVFPSICASLGTWQVFRWRQKLELLQCIETQHLSAPKAVLSPSEIDSDTQKYSISGLKSTGKQVLVGPRGNSSIPGGYASLLFESAQLSNGEHVILNRGWVPRGRESDITKLDSDSVVVVKDSEERKPLLGKANSAKQLFWKDWTKLSALFNVRSLTFLKVISEKSSPPLIPHTLSTSNIPNRHLEYILTWYSLASFSFLMSFLKK